MIGGWVERSLRGGWRDVQWRLEETLQLHRGAYGAAGMKGIWEESLDAVPRTVERNVQMPPSSEIWGVGVQHNGGAEPVDPVVQEIILLGSGEPVLAGLARAEGRPTITQSGAARGRRLVPHFPEERSRGETVCSKPAKPADSAGNCPVADGLS
jgi:hypothetical protein